MTRLSEPQATALMTYIRGESDDRVRTNTRRSLERLKLIVRTLRKDRPYQATDTAHRVLAEHMTTMTLQPRDFGGWHVLQGETKLGWAVYSREADRWTGYVTDPDRPLQGMPVYWDATLVGICMNFEDRARNHARRQEKR
ncbi:hypothetical protein SUDANB95_07924 (plasmid) [Actinosynnema sp. ALI-1.44]